MKTVYFIWSVKMYVQNKIDRPFGVFVQQIADSVPADNFTK